MDGNRDEIDRLIVIAGASCTGKTTLVEGLRGATPRPALPPELGSWDMSGFTFVDAIGLADPERAPLPRRCVLHYDIFRPVTFHDTTDFDSDPALELLRRSARLDVLTLWEDPTTLLARSLSRRRRLWRKVARRSSLSALGRNVRDYRGARARRRKMHPWFADPDRLWQLYEGWFDAVEAARADSHLVVRPSEGFEVSDPGRTAPRTPLWPVGASPGARPGRE